MKPITGMMLFGLVLSWSVQAASFDCGKAETKVEKLICANKELSAMDNQLAVAYQAALRQTPDPAALKTSQQQWLKNLYYCKTARCLEGAYWARTMALQNAEPDGQAGWARAYGVPEPMPQREKDKAAKVKVILAQHPMRLYEGIKAKNRAFCNSFYEALRTASPKITYIEPVFRTDDPTHPALGEYLACDLYEPKTPYIYFSMNEFGRRAIRLYRVDMDGNTRNGLEEYLYGQEPDGYGIHGERSAASYVQADFSKCERRNGVGVSAENPTDERFIDASGTNALVRYLGRHYVYNLSRIGTEKDYYSLDLSDYGSRGFSPQLCSWKVPHNQ